MTNRKSSPVTDRRKFTSDLIASCPEALVVAGLGSPAYDVFAAGDRGGNFYLWGAMGGAAALGLGLALAQPKRAVLVITGDGEQLMGMGALATIGAARPRNLTVVVLDNGHYGETGMQRSHTSLGTSLSGVARACGMANILETADIEGAQRIAAHARAMNGSTFAQVFVSAEEAERALPPRDGVYIKNRFRATLGLAPV